MREIVADSNRLVTTRRSRRLQAIDFRHVRRSAEGLHDALECGPWGCRCPEPHHASLRLESRIQPLNHSTTPLDGETLQLRFRVLFQSSDVGTGTVQDWRETDIVPRQQEALASSQPTIAA